MEDKDVLEQFKYLLTDEKDIYTVHTNYNYISDDLEEYELFVIFYYKNNFIVYYDTSIKSNTYLKKGQYNLHSFDFNLKRYIKENFSEKDYIRLNKVKTLNLINEF